MPTADDEKIASERCGVLDEGGTGLTSEEPAVEEAQDGESVAEVANRTAAVRAVECARACAKLHFVCVRREGTSAVHGGTGFGDILSSLTSLG